MGRLSFALYDNILIENKVYQVVGMIEFKNNSDQKTWTEYKLKRSSDSKIYWLSIDLCYKEYAIYTEQEYADDKHSDGAIMRRGYKRSDTFKAKVIACEGDVDVDIGDGVSGTEYEDKTEELIIAIEQWGDEVEYSEGYYLDDDEIRTTGGNVSSSGTSSYRSSYINNTKGGSGNKLFSLILFGMIFLCPALAALFDSLGSKKAIYNYLKDNSGYTYETSITSTGAEKEKAHVFISSYSLDYTVKDIISGIDGNTVDVSENDDTDDNSVVILTNKEYCLVYVSEDDEVLVQVSSRLYTYTSNSTPHRSRNRTRNFYRGYYYENVYSEDSSDYDSYTSYYSDADTTDFDTTSSTDSTYNSYSSSVRQYSTSSRNSSGGGSSYGK